MHTNKKLLVIVVAATLTACGGGEPAPQPASPDATIRALRVRAQALRNDGVAPEEAARQLMDAAEASPAYQQYFPQHQQTQSMAPFVFRYYPDTGIYLGVVITAGTPYELGSVYVMGGVFGNAPQNVGPLTSYITPVAPSTSGSSANNGCFDLDAAFRGGTHTVVSYQNGSDIHTEDTTVGGVTTFEGVSATAITARLTGSFSGQTLDITTITYRARTGDAQATEYGTTMSGPGVPSMRTVYSPPYVNPMASLAAGQSVTTTMSGTESYTINGAPQSSSFSSNYTITYVGHETVTVPAGTYDACRFDTSYGGTQAPSSEWFIAGKDILVKSVYGGEATQATSVQVNGQRL